MKKVIFLSIIIVLLLCTSCRRTVVTTPDVQVISAAKISLEANDSVWNNTPTHGSKLILQDFRSLVIL